MRRLLVACCLLLVGMAAPASAFILDAQTKSILDIYYLKNRPGAVGTNQLDPQILNQLSSALTNAAAFDPTGSAAAVIAWVQSCGLFDPAGSAAAVSNWVSTLDLGSGGNPGITISSNNIVITYDGTNRTVFDMNANDDFTINHDAGTNDTVISETITTNVGALTYGSAYFDGASSRMAGSTNMGRFPSATNKFGGYAWVNRQTNGMVQGIMSKMRVGTGAKPGWNFQIETDNRFTFAICDNASQSTGTTIKVTSLTNTVPTNAWSMIGFAWDGSLVDDGVKLYQDGVPIAVTSIYSAPFTMTNMGVFATNENFALGSILWTNNPARFLKGYLDEVVLFSTEMTDAIVSNAWNSGTGVYANAAESPWDNAMAIYHLDETSGNVVADSTANGHTLTNSGASWSTIGAVTTNPVITVITNTTTNTTFYGNPIPIWTSLSSNGYDRMVTHGGTNTLTIVKGKEILFIEDGVTQHVGVGGGNLSALSNNVESLQSIIDTTNLSIHLLENNYYEPTALLQSYTNSESLVSLHTFLLTKKIYNSKASEVYPPGGGDPIVTYSWDDPIEQLIFRIFDTGEIYINSIVFGTGSSTNAVINDLGEARFSNMQEGDTIATVEGMATNQSIWFITQDGDLALKTNEIISDLYWAIAEDGSVYMR